MNGPARRSLCDFVDGSVELYSLAELRSERVGQHLQPFIKRKLRRAILGDLTALLTFPRAKNLAFDHRAVVVFERLKLGKGVRDGKFVGIARINPRHERVDRVIKKF